MRLSFLGYIALLAARSLPSEAWSPVIPIQSKHGRVHAVSLGYSYKSSPNTFNRNVQLQSTPTDDDNSAEAESEGVVFSDDEVQAITEIWTQSKGDAHLMQELVTQALATMHPSLILKLRRQHEEGDDSKVTAEARQVAKALTEVLNSRMAGAKEVLSDLLDCGEIRKLDAAIGKAARQGQLDMAFFTVLSMNLQDASEVELKQQNEQAASPDEEEDKSANRFSILTHIYTRCQEEVEKTVSPGMALLNKLLRTDIDSIRQNQLEHYLTPQKNVISSPDGKEIQLQGVQKVLVPPSEFVQAMEQAIKQIRTVEKAGGTDPRTAASMVESCRTVAKEARIIIGTSYGVDSEELIAYEDALMPVFRPSSPESPYIQGE